MKTKKIKDVEQIMMSPVEIIERNDFARYVELPCLEACLYLYDMNIHPYSSGCNKVNYDNAHIMIYYDDLSIENREVAEELVKKGYGMITTYNDEKFLTIAIKTNLDDDVKKVSDNLLDVVKKFTYQDVLYGFMTKEEFIKENIEMCLIFRYVDGELIPNFPGDYDEEELEDKKREVLFDANEAFENCVDEGRVDLVNDIVWRSRELFDKHIDYFDSVKGVKSK